MSGSKPEPRLFNLHEELQGTFRMVTSYANLKNVEFNHHVPAGIELEADVEMLKLVVRNLAVNAVKFTPGTQGVELTCKQMCSYVHFEIKDQGVGMDGKRRDMLFQREMSSLPGTNNAKGVGLGLFLCKSCVDSHGGYIQRKAVWDMVHHLK